MVDLRDMLVGGIIGAFIWALILAAILRWRARKLKSWTIPFGKAYVVSLVAGLSAFAFALVLALGIGFFGFVSEIAQLIPPLGSAIVWYFVHAAALEKVAGNSTALTAKDARGITSSVIAMVFVGLLAIAAVVAALSFFSTK